MLSPTAETIRTTLHVLAATIWVGGQFTLAGLVPGLRARDSELPRVVARKFNRIAWPAFAVLVATGIWQLLSRNLSEQSSDYNVTLFVKLLVVALSGLSAAAHSTTRSRVVLAVGGAVAGLTAVAAVFLGLLLGTGR